MAINPITLDDLTWADLTDAARQRIPAASNGRWTLHAPVDPGVTLVELHAWLLEQRLYWMNHVPDALSRGALTLLGEAARDAVCASTVLQFPASALTSLAAGTSVQLRDSDPPLIFTTQTPLTLLPVASTPGRAALPPPRLDIVVDGINRADDLVAGRDLCVFQSAGDEIAITLWLTAPLTPLSARAELTLLVLLDQPGSGVPVQWSADAVDGIAPAATLSWWYASGPGGQRTKFGPGAVADGTGGMRRSGIVRLALPQDWAAGSPDLAGQLPYTLWLRAETAGFSAPPRLAGLWPNVAIASHRRSLKVRRDLDWLPLPGNMIRLSAEEQPVLQNGSRIRLMERDGKLHWWLPTPDLSFHGREDRVFVADRAAGTFVFGNGETGRIPRPAAWFALRDLIDPAALATDWKGTDAVSAFLVSLLSPTGVARIAAYVAKAAPSRPVLRALLEGLNSGLASASLYDKDRFGGVALSDGTRALVALKSSGQQLSLQQQEHLNRLLLEDAYPHVLVSGAAELRLSIGGGIAGMVGSQLVWEGLPPSPVAPAMTVPVAVNPVAAIDGADPELLADARQRAAQTLRRVERAVLASDFEALAITTPGVAIRRAHAAVGWHPDFPCLPVPGAVTVFIVPDVPRDGASAPCAEVAAPVPDAGAAGAVAARLDSARLIGSEVFVRSPLYRPVALSIDVQTSTSAPDTLRTTVAKHFARFLDPLAGGEDKAGWPFGEKLRPSTLLRQAQDAIGYQGEVLRLGILLLDTGAVEETCKDVEIGPHALPALTRVTTRVMPTPAGTVGGLS
ncbi:hypothetical protein LMG28614_00725 [Paraburkholderia ultramafica]|uniref:Uncharacterized protein n=1 Tax=Paraburkholderia ultramafica TaxID=1544867 RepID=A0A6S7B3U9_9BURK|nr:baseplate J/gp47 family protein [Paraburkholderia ultramafica]CAB3778772.1 hypothetical protein LMG28614_00725 [Paraburkholderia ultramafica]